MIFSPTLQAYYAFTDSSTIYYPIVPSQDIPYDDLSRVVFVQATLAKNLGKVLMQTF